LPKNSSTDGNLTCPWCRDLTGWKSLPPAEIIFEGYGTEKPRIVDYRAKWDESSYEYHHTSRSFSFGPQDTILVSELKALGCQMLESFWY
jgi:D-alanine-D-alanine ligase